MRTLSQCLLHFWLFRLHLSLLRGVPTHLGAALASASFAYSSEIVALVTSVSFRVSSVVVGGNVISGVVDGIG